ncbi:MAG: TraB/GumN family protein [Treponema sp.]|nr:TraB/GumN family protein [Treponema sp.]
MKRIISFFTVAVFLVGLFSCASTSAAVQSGSSVWKVSRGGNTIFLGGSVHILRNKDFPLPREFDLAFSQSTMLVLEADIEQMENEELAQYLVSQMVLPGGRTLQSILEPAVYALLKAECAKYGFSIEAVSNFKPSMVLTMLSMLQVQKTGFVQQGVDAHFLEKAHRAEMPVNFLETVETQIDMLLAMGEGYENDFVRYSLSDMSDNDDENVLIALVTEWRTGGMAISEASLIELKETWPAIYQTLVADRNAAWIPQIEEYLDSGQRPFIVVGLFHMHGPDGLLTQLENSGCTVEQLR